LVDFVLENRPQILAFFEAVAAVPPVPPTFDPTLHFKEDETWTPLFEIHTHLTTISKKLQLELEDQAVLLLLSLPPPPSPLRVTLFALNAADCETIYRSNEESRRASEAGASGSGGGGSYSQEDSVIYSHRVGELADLVVQ
jgi:hypothetical protein